MGGPGFVQGFGGQDPKTPNIVVACITFLIPFPTPGVRVRVAGASLVLRVWWAEQKGGGDETHTRATGH